MTEDLGAVEGISRRDMLKKSAIVGGAGALAWAAPSITRYGGAAFGDTTGTPMGKGISYIALKYTCDGGETFRYIKWDDYQGGNWNCQTGDFETPGCGDLGNTGATADDGCKLFTLTVLSFNSDGEPVSVKVCFVGGTTCTISGEAYGKCGAPGNEASGGQCVEVAPTNKCVTIDMCGV